VTLSNDPQVTAQKLANEHFDALVVDIANEEDATLLFKSARDSELNHSSLCVAVVEGQMGVAKAFRIGANLVLTKPINIEQSKGTLRVARGLLRNINRLCEDRVRADAKGLRSEEHTSELQSREKLVCRLLLDASYRRRLHLSLHDALPIFCAWRWLKAKWELRRPFASARTWSSQSRLILSTPKERCAWHGVYCAILIGFVRTGFAPMRKALDRKSTRLNSSHVKSSYAVFCLMHRIVVDSIFPYTTLFRSSVRGGG